MDDARTADEVTEFAGSDSSWRPGEFVTRHSGGPIEPDFDFFAVPPPEIGEIVSAETTLLATTRPWRLASRIALSGLIGWSAAMVLEAIVSTQPNPGDPAVFRLLEAAMGVAGAGLTWYFTRFSYMCSYVGNQGLARLSCRGDRSRLSPAEVFVFEHATELRTSQTRMYHNGIYTGTRYAYQWTGSDDAKVYKIAGTYRGEKAPPKPKDPFHFAVMAESAWSATVFDRSTEELELTGSIRFRLSGGDYLAVGPGFLDIHRKGETEHLTADEIGDVVIDQGVVKIRRADAKEGWFSSSGVTKIGYETMANSKLFGLAYSRLVGK